jgi:hypothetical protein
VPPRGCAEVAGSNSTCGGWPSAAEVVLPESAALGSAAGCLAALACSSAALQHAHPPWLSRYLITIQGTSICHRYALLGPAHQMCVPQQHHGKLSWEAPMFRTVPWWPAVAATAAPAQQHLPARGWRFRPWTQRPAGPSSHESHHRGPGRCVRHSQLCANCWPDTFASELSDDCESSGVRWAAALPVHALNGCDCICQHRVTRQLACLGNSHANEQ